MNAKIKTFREQTSIQEEVVSLIASSIEPPIYYHSGKVHRGFIFTKPGAEHFCLLKAARAVSGLNAVIVLCEHGYPQEIAVLIRTIVECTTHIDYVLAGYDENGLKEKQRKYVEQYFADFRRDNVSDFGRLRVRQGDVHKVVGAHTDKQIRKIESASEFHEVNTPELLSNVYLTYSNYVHCRYPEAMDLYGGVPPHFHMKGMLGTPKDAENMAIVETFLETVSIALKFMVLKFGMIEEIRKNTRLLEWYHTSA